MMSAGAHHRAARQAQFAVRRRLTLLGAFPLAFFCFAFVTDLVYTRTYYLQWQYFSIWLITAGRIMGGASIFFGAIDWLITRRTVARRGSGWHIILTLVAWVLALVNAFVHSRDGLTAVAGEGKGDELSGRTEGGEPHHAHPRCRWRVEAAQYGAPGTR